VAPSLQEEVGEQITVEGRQIVDPEMGQAVTRQLIQLTIMYVVVEEEGGIMVVGQEESRGIPAVLGAEEGVLGLLRLQQS